jgi:hypothetical protein
MGIKVGSEHYESNRRFAVQYVKTVLRDARDWQDGQAALADHPTIGPWLRGAFKGEALAVVQSIIRDAEDELTGEGVELNY